MKFLGTYVMLLFSVLSGAQGMRFSHLDQKQGLSQNTPDCFLQDSEGLMWIGTQDGLNRYDGYTFTVLRSVPGDTNSLTDNFILALAEDSDNNIWIGTRNGICVYVKSENKFYRYRSIYEDPDDFHAAVRNIVAINEGGVVFCTKSRNLVSVKYDATHHHIIATGLVDESNVYAFAYEKQTGELAFLLNDRLCIGLPGNATITCSLNLAGKPIISMLLDGEHLFLNDSLNILHIPIRTQGIPETIYTCDSKVACMSIGPNHSVWIGTLEGLRVINSPLSSPVIEVATENKLDYFGLNGNRLEALYCTRENIMWVGTVGGINIYDPLQKRFIVLDGILSTPTQDAIWFVMSIGEIVLWANDKGLMTYSESPLPRWVNSIPKELPYSAGGFDSRNRLWLGTKNQGVIIVDTANNTVDTRLKSHPVFAGVSVMDFCSDNGSMWIASIGSLCVVQENDLEVKIIRSRQVHAKDISTAYFSALEKDDQHRIYVGTATGLAVFAPTDTNVQWIVNDPATPNSLAYNIVNDLFILGDNLWIATMGSGLDRMNIRTQDFIHYSTGNGLANNTIYGIEAGNSDELWLSSNEGMIQLNINNGISRNFTMRDGLTSNEFVLNKHSSNKNATQLYFGSSNGLVNFSPDDFRTLSPPVLPIITRMTVNYKPRTQFMSDELQLKSDERNISFEFSAIDFRNQDKISYAYKLEGFDTAWHNTGIAERSANFTNLPYGTYHFMVRYRIGGGEWSSTILEKKIVIATPFYATTWFTILMILAGITLIALIVRYISQRTLRKQIEELRVQEQIRNEKERISRDLHDNVGAQLTYVISSLDNLSYTLQRKKVDLESEKLDQLGEFARGTMDQLRESIWAINSEQIKLSELAAKWKQYLAQLADTRSNFSGQVAFSGTDVTLKPATAIEVHRIIQEAISNAFRHSNGTNILVEVDIENNKPSVSVIDNGRGMSEQPEKDGHYGLRNMKERAKRINGDLSFRTDSNGTNVHLFWHHN